MPGSSDVSLFVVPEQPSSDQQQQTQVKLCVRCHNLVDPASFVYIPEADAIICLACRDHVLPPRNLLPTPESRPICNDVDSDFPRLTDVNVVQTTRRSVDCSFDEDVDMDPSAGPSADYQQSHSNSAHKTHSTNYVSKYSQFSASSTPSTNSTAFASLITSSHSPARKTHSASSPLTDITRLRVRSHGHQCLYPGASFQGTQKSGRNSYDVNVTIVDVDFASSFLCGYLRIRGLTDDWPELTTYFDAEIIGSRYGFLTQNWGANEQEDMVHWSRFPAFKHVKNELKKPLLTMPDRERSSVFMRWKERFLVPDHRVQDINGASFAGFYYVCVDFNPSNRSGSQNLPLVSECGDAADVGSRTSLKADAASLRSRRDSSARRRIRSGSTTPRYYTPPVASMSGFYFHQNSEPYQELSLSHVPERWNSSFEFR